MMLQNSIKNIFTGVLVCIVLTKNASAQKMNEFSVKQCVDYGMKNSVQVKNALLDIQIQKQVNKEFTGNAYPQLSSSVSTTHYYDIPSQVIPNFIGPATYQVLVNEGVKNGSGNTITMPNAGDFGSLALQFGTPWNASAGFDISQLLFDGQVFIGLKARRTSLAFASKASDITQEQIKANIYKIYYQLVVGKKQLESINANIGRFEKLLSDTKEIYKNGFTEKLDVDKVTVTLTNLKTEKEKIEDQLAVGNAGLKFLINMPQKETLVLADSLSDTDLKSGILDSSYNYTDRKEIQLLNLAAKLNQYNIKRYQLSKLPTIAAFGSYSKNAQRSEFNFFNKGDWYTTALVGVKLSLPLFNGFSRNARIDNAKLTYEKTNNTLEAAKQQVDYDVFNARTKMKSAILTADNQKRNIDLSENVYYTTKKKYEQGLGSNTDIYNAQTELKVAQTNYYSALYDAITAKVDYLVSVGKL